MMTTVCWGKIIRARWSDCAGLLALAAVFASAATGADINVTRLGQGVQAWKVHDYSTATQQLSGVDVVRLGDYTAYYLGASQLLNGDADAALRTFAAYSAHPVKSSPLAGKIAALYGRALLDQHNAASSRRALEILQSGYKDLPQPDGDFALALAYEAVGEKLQAALTYGRVFYAWPNTDLAAQAWTALERLRTALGKDFPAAPATQQLERARRWIDVHEYAKARQEYSVLAGSLPEPDRDQARVGIGASDYYAGETAAAFRYLKDLHTARGDADAKRLYYIAECARKQGDDAELTNAVRALDQRYPESVWRLKTLVSAGNRYLYTNDRDKYEPLFRAAFASFPADSSTAYAHWKIAWDAYLEDKPEREKLLREHVEKYSSDSSAATALYFLARNAEKNGEAAKARSAYERLSVQYPHYYYGTMARERLKQPKVSAAAPDSATAEWLDAIDWPEHRDFSSVEANAATRARIDRARLLMLAGLPDAADAELRFGAKTDDEQPHLLAMELARSMPSPFHALRIMKSFSTDYLALPIQSAPLKFWQYLFPLPYRDDVTRYAKANNLDPYLVAALIRQETEFNPGAHSGANAYGLMQLVLPTGRMVGRQQGVAVSSARTLLDPTVSIHLGTAYLRSQLDQWGGDFTRTLAAYNAGPGRVKQWLAWNTYREPEEFVESIPFTETREYVQAVLRNADMYRTIYGTRTAAPDVKDSGEVPPVQLSTLPLAARTPGGGVKTVVARPVKKPAAASKKSLARKPAAKKKRRTA